MGTVSVVAVCVCAVSSMRFAYSVCGGSMLPRIGRQLEYSKFLI